MRIAILTNAFPPEAKGGAGQIAALQVDVLRSAGHEVRVWHPQITWFSRSVPVRLLRHVCDLWPSHETVAEIVAWKPEVLITHNLTGCGFATPQAIRTHHLVRWFHVLHDVQLFEPSGQLVSAVAITWWQRLWSSLRRRALGQPDVVVTPTQWLLDEHKRRGFFSKGLSMVLPNPAPVAQTFDRALHAPLRLLFVGRVSEDKGANLLAGLLNELDVPFLMEIVGTGPDMNALLEHSQRIHAFGVASPEQVLARMREADVLLVPSQIEENQPTVILEAASVGLPVIASDKGGIRETLRGAGIICPAQDLGAWKQAIQSLIEEHVYQQAVMSMKMIAEQHERSRYQARFTEALRGE
ncbi:MAG: glycosyltransferase [Patescibacteria group bacterium]